MIRILVIGYAPDAADFTDPAIPPGLDEAKVAEGIERDLKLMRDRGWEAEHLPIRADGGLRRQVIEHLAGQFYNCIVIGAGAALRVPKPPT